MVKIMSSSETNVSAETDTEFRRRGMYCTRFVKLASGIGFECHLQSRHANWYHTCIFR